MINLLPDMQRLKFSALVNGINKTRCGSEIHQGKNIILPTVTEENANEFGLQSGGEAEMCFTTKLPRAAVFSHTYVTKPQPFTLKDNS